MGRTERKRWTPIYSSGLPRREIRGCEYESYIPEALLDQEFLLEGDVAADVSDAEAAIRNFSRTSPALSDTEGIARLLLRAEAVASSRIEGVLMGSGRLLRAEAAAAAGESATDATATEILGNIRAMRTAMSMASQADSIAVDDLLEIHRQLLETTEMSAHAGRLRTEQNWVGGNEYNPCAAAFVPPPPEEVPALVDDLCRFLRRDHLPPLVQAAIAHAQFETIHPFADGNGRTGRTLIHVVLRRRGLAPGTIIPISLMLATWSDRYIGGLNRYRFEGTSSSLAAREAFNQWVAFFATAALRAVQEAEIYQLRINELRERWRNELGAIRKGSALDRLLEQLPGAPVLTVNAAAELVERTFPATNDAVDRLVTAGILRPIRIGRRNRAFEAGELVALFTDFERSLASPDGDTAISPPSRPAPAKNADG